MRKSAFALCDDHNAYIGYTSGRTWNGWATPYFTLEEAQKLQAEWNKGGDSTMLYDANKDQFVCKYEDDDEPYIWEGEDIKTEDGIKHLYGIGAYSHIWDDLGDEDKRYLAEIISDFLYDYDPHEYNDQNGDEYEVIDASIEAFADIDVFAKAHKIMNNAKLSADERYAKLGEILNI